MNANRLINMAFRMLMRFGMKQMNQRNRKNGSGDQGRNQPQIDADVRKKMKAARRINRM